MTKLTARQEQILELLLGDEHLGAREIAARLGVSRNAVYQQIAALKKKGAIPEGFTPTGEVRVQLGRTSEREHGGVENQQVGAEELMRRLTGRVAPGPDNAALDVIRELVAMNKQLVDVVERLSARS